MARKSGIKTDLHGRRSKTNTVSTAEVGARVAQSLGVPREQIITPICQKIPKKKLQQ